MSKEMHSFVVQQEKPSLGPLNVIRTALGLRKGETLSEFIERRQAEITQKQDDRKRTQTASPTEEEEVESSLISLRALRDKPLVKVNFWNGGAKARLPEVKLDVESLSGRSVPVAPDFRPAFLKAHWPEVEADVRKQVADHYRDNQILALSAAEKRKRLQKLDAEILDLERQEVAAIFEARKQGIKVAFRTDTDPRAILAIEGPPPRKR